MHRGRKASGELRGELDSDGSALLLQSRPAWMEIEGEITPDSNGSTVLLQSQLVWMEIGGEMTPGWGSGTGQVEERASNLAIQLKQQLSRLVWRLQQAGSCAASQISCQSTNSLEKIY